MVTKVFRRLVSLLGMVSLLAGTSLVAYAAAQGTHAQSTTNFTFTPVADAYVSASNPASNFGSNLSLREDSSPIMRSYVRFTVQGLNGSTVQSAKIRLYANSANAVGVSVRSLADNTWAESKITYNNAPVPGAIINSSKSCASGAWLEVDISSYVKAAGTYNLVLTTTSASNIKLSSREAGSKAPQLVVTAASLSTSTPTLAVTQAPTFTATPATPPTQAPTDTPAPTQVPTQSPTATAAPTQTPITTDWQPSFPIRAAFYYPWFSEAWTQLGIYPYTNYTPSLGYYSSLDSAVLAKHLAMMQYANIQVGIASWWGQGQQTDTKIPGLLTAASGTHFRWALYYEQESQGDPSASQIQSDLTYIRDHYGKDPSFLRVNGKFVVFVYASPTDGCGMADRWKQGNTVGAYVVLKVFPGYSTCASQPDSWHQYAPAVAADQQGTTSYSISPGFWLVGNPVRLTRDLTRWTQNVKDMVASGAKWQLVTTFSEWGEGTAVEPAQEWSSASGNGQYLDALHYNGNMP